MIVLATIDEQENPYTSNMYFKVDEDYNFYFQSKNFREHSKHIAKNNKVAWSILNTEKYEKSAKNKKWLQFQWTAEMLTWKEAERIKKELYGKSMSFFEIFQSGHMIYKCTPSRVKIWDETLYGWEGKIIKLK
jgi:uncharacterized protein YhbP (UPF0306 family)